MRVALATFAGLPDGWPDDRLAAGELEAAGAAVEFPVWSDRDVQWERFDRVVVRSTWDYTLRRDEFLEWTERVGDRLRNAPPLIRWNSDKRYLSDLAYARLPVIETTFVGPGDAPPALDGEVVVKPTISAGARDTGRFSARTHDAALTLIGRLQTDGRIAMVQPYASGIDEQGETAIVLLGGRESHVLEKRPVLSPDEVAPLSDNPIGAAEAMFREDLVVAGTASDDERALAADVRAYLERRFGSTPLYARVDMAPGPDGSPTLMELEAVEPNLYMSTASGSARRFAEAILGDAGRTS